MFFKPEPDVPTIGGGGPFGTQSLETGGNSPEAAESKQTSNLEDRGHWECAGGMTVDDAGSGGGTSREHERDYKRKRRPRPHCSMEEDGPLVCAVCGDLALGCVPKIL